MRSHLRKLLQVLQLGRVAEPTVLPSSSPALLDDATFWYVIERCNNLSGSNQQYYNLLWSMLNEMDAVAVAGFAERVARLRQPLHDWNVWAAAKFIFPAMPFDAFYGFQSWIISAGKEACLSVAEDSDSLPNAIRIAGHRDLVFDGFDRIPAEVLSQKVDAEKYPIPAGKRLSHEHLKGNHWELSTLNLASRFPKLSAVLGRAQTGSAGPERPVLH